MKFTGKFKESWLKVTAVFTEVILGVELNCYSCFYTTNVATATSLLKLGYCSLSVRGHCHALRVSSHCSQFPEIP